ncbi:MAG TPA: DUF3311 domain-containing protein [Mycobacteriales bacterium]|nr:DUF3311 domain-containing protein [Mycobacteriales bacterium]
MSAPERERSTSATDRSPWNWLLVVPIVVPLLTFAYNREEPTLLGFPFYYWAQFACIVLGVSTTTLVYQMTKRRG